MSIPAIVRVNVIVPMDGGPARVVPQSEQQAFKKVQPYGFVLSSHWAMEIDGLYFPLSEAHVRDETFPGLGVWTLAGVDAEETAKDAEIAALPPSLRAKYAKDHVPWPVRKIVREADDLDMEARKLEGEAEAIKLDKKSDSDPDYLAKKAEADAKRAEATAKRVEADAAKAAAGVP
jgi:hypothetical protein